MGIPSYYKKLIDIVPGLVSKGHQDVNWLFMDFNCLIYHCIDDVPYPQNGDAYKWETQFIDCIITYCLKVIKEVNPTTGVFIAIDGVVPMAKMRQQRLRRFKSAWLSKNDTSSTSSTTNTVKWDKNAITPGTLFMAKLKTSLEIMTSTHKNWILSSSDEPGEGEHKIMVEWRKGTYKGNYAVYGLDADLIVLSMLGHECCNLNNIWLFREEVCNGKISYDSFGEEIFNWFSINILKGWLSSNSDNKREFILNYCFALSILGNDFLPSSLGLKMREDGHSVLLDIITSFTSKNILLITPTLDISMDGVIELFKVLSMNESFRICKYIHKKQMFANNIETELKLGENNWPLSHIEESILMNKKQLCSNWQDIYITFFNGFNIDNICKEYLYGIQWIWAYYTGRTDVCFNWFYPHSLPPLWQWLSIYLSINKLPSFPDIILVTVNDIKPIEQLALVLPLESWSLIPPSVERSIPFLAPQYYPTEFSFESIGKRYFWECEAMIPIPSILDIKVIVK